MPLGFEPNVTHCVLAQWEKAGKLRAVITQNIDGLHQKAGSQCVHELHGSVLKNYCLRCGKEYSTEFIRDSRGIPTCTCGGMVRPDVVLYEEGLNSATIDESIEAIADADLLIVAGSSLTVYPAAGLLDYYSGDRLVIINRDMTARDGIADLIFRCSLGEVFSQLLD